MGVGGKNCSVQWFTIVIDDNNNWRECDGQHMHLQLQTDQTDAATCVAWRSDHYMSRAVGPRGPACPACILKRERGKSPCVPLQLLILYYVSTHHTVSASFCLFPPNANHQ